VTATLPDLLADLAPATDFSDAPCIGRWSWFDPPNDHEPAASVQSRHEAAAHVCGTCPSSIFARCANTARGMRKATPPRCVGRARLRPTDHERQSHDDDPRAAEHCRAEAGRQARHQPAPDSACHHRHPAPRPVADT